MFITSRTVRRNTELIIINKTEVIMNDSYIDDRKLHEECGVFGVYDFDGVDVASTIYYGLFALQHRGQESCGIAVSDTEGPKGKVLSHKDMGLVNEVFNPDSLEKLKGNIGVGHVRYSTAGSSTRENAQPLVLNYVKGTLGMAHNGNLLNAVELREELSYTGAIFQTTIDSEVIAYLIARERLNTGTVEDAVKNAMKKIKGAYSLIVMSPRKLIGARDPFGFKPLCIGKRDNAYFLSSETCALDTVGAEFIRDVLPGEIVTITKDGIKSDTSLCQKNTARCIFEYIYFARPDSKIDGMGVYESRVNAGLYMQLQNPQLFIHRSYIYTSLTISKKEGYPLLFNTSLSAHLSTYINCWWFNRIVTCKAGITEACLITYHLTKLVCFKVSK
jgi:amidophosphoribosyltransferase